MPTRRPYNAPLPPLPAPAFEIGDIVVLRDTASNRERFTRIEPGTVGIVERVRPAQYRIGGGGSIAPAEYGVAWETADSGTTSNLLIATSRIRAAR